MSMYLEFAKDLGGDENVKRVVVSVYTRYLLVSPINNTDTSSRARFEQIKIDPSYNIYELSYFPFLRGDS